MKILRLRPTNRVSCPRARSQVFMDIVTPVCARHATPSSLDVDFPVLAPFAKKDVADSQDWEIYVSLQSYSTPYSLGSRLLTAMIARCT
jgi:hypothetical protein